MTDKPESYIALPPDEAGARQAAFLRTLPMGTPRAVGICGSRGPKYLATVPAPVCTLAAGHTGWHHNDDNGDWTDEAEVIRLFDVGADVEFYEHRDGVWEEGKVARDYGDDRIDVRAYGLTHRCRREDVRVPEALRTIEDPIRLIDAERRRVIEKGRTPEHDDEHTDGSLARAAAVYAAWAGDVRLPQVWPWPEQPKLWDTIDALVKAGQLIVAEILRLQRAKAQAAEAEQEAKSDG